jgi:hypothetical protein
VTDPAGVPMPISALPAALTGPYGKAFSVGFNRDCRAALWRGPRWGVGQPGKPAPPPAAGSTADAAAAEEPTI